jgi:hypothetical protein
VLSYQAPLAPPAIVGAEGAGRPGIPVEPVPQEA